MIEKNIEKQKPKAYTDKIPVYCAFDELVDPRSLRGNPKNPNVHPKTQVTLLAQIIERQGWRAPITVSKRSGLIVRGHGRLMAALEKNLTKAPVDYQSYDSEDEEYADMLADNRLAELAETDEDALGELLGELEKSEIPLWLTGYTDIDLEAYITETVKDDGEPGGVNDVDSIPDMPVVSMTQPGDLYILDGKHRILCGDCTNDKDRERLFDGAMPEIMLTDPPYCSGGFQESRRVSGSIGKRCVEGNMPKIANDTLSTRGYQRLLRSAIQGFPGLIMYIFTDWRMWVSLFDVVESSGYGVRSMIVWDKQAIGLGFGWRPQHELIMFSHKTKAKWDIHKGYGNVLTCKRTFNPLHPTQKPVELIEQILGNTSWASGVYDSFAGSGSILIACDTHGQSCYAMEVEPKYCDVIVRRYKSWRENNNRSANITQFRDGAILQNIGS